jgi:ABC-type multidrug transport system fused ATPase/permease subunit
MLLMLLLSQCAISAARLNCCILHTIYSVCYTLQAISSMTTVRSFAAERLESSRYAVELAAYYGLNVYTAWAYGLYASVAALLPQLVTALVLFYGGKLVMRCVTLLNSNRCSVTALV